MSMREYVFKSQVEVIACKNFEQSHSKSGVEKIKKIVVPDFEYLGKLTALRFIEWCQLNPSGVISLATGKTPQSFIKWAQFFIKNWNEPKVQQELELWQIDAGIKIDFANFILVQMDEYFPINSYDEKSFYSYINTNYIKNFGFKPEKCLFMNISQSLDKQGIDIDSVFPDGNVDISLEFKTPKNSIEQAQLNALSLVKQFASKFESQIQELGGIGFFLGGIGPDGHIAFNFRGSEHSTSTRLLPMNYESAAAAAAGFGGIEFIRNKAALTIGLQTITQNPTTTAIILADGIGKAQVVKDAIESITTTTIPATALYNLHNSRFYLTTSAASKLKTQQYQKYLECKNTKKFTTDWTKQILIDICLEKKKQLDQLTSNDIKQSFFGDLFIKNINDPDRFIANAINVTIDTLKSNINRGAQSYVGETFLHTSPHADDVMLGYLPLISQLASDKTTSHYFVTVTSGANTVQNKYFEQIINNLDKSLETLIPLKQNSDSDLEDYFTGIKQNNLNLQEKAFASRMLRSMVKFLNINLKNDSIDLIKNKIAEIKTTISNNSSSSLIIDLKRSVREWEEDLVWGHLGFGQSNVFHMNLGFYSSKDKNIIFERDVQPVIDLLNKTKPNVITVALDPKDGGHPTHYKVAQIIAQALNNYKSNKEIKIWGYNNVWFKFRPTQSNLFFPASSNDFKLVKNIFKTCYKSQVIAAVPSPEYDGPFCDLIQKIMHDQYNILKQCLGVEFFTENKNQKIVTADGFGFIKVMTVEEFLYAINL